MDKQFAISNETGGTVTCSATTESMKRYLSKQMQPATTSSKCDDKSSAVWLRVGFHLLWARILPRAIDKAVVPPHLGFKVRLTCANAYPNIFNKVDKIQSTQRRCLTT